MNKQRFYFVWLFLLVASCNLQAEVDNKGKEAEIIGLILKSKPCPKQSFFTNAYNYWGSPDCIHSLFNFSCSAALTIGIALFYMRMQQKATDFLGNQTLKVYYPGDINCSLDDVAGLAGAKADMQDIMDYLKNPVAYQDMGAKIPKGVLMNGPAGNGKTMLARAVAGTVNCPFVSVAGASFVQMFVGLGAARVRDLFNLAKNIAQQYGACIIFIDEIDALARKRSSFGGCSDREHDQTIAQLLECMDGLEGCDFPVIVLAATNRSELLDPAVVRPGRFDRKVEIASPLMKDRVVLLQNALHNVKADLGTINIESIARITYGFSGAELANLVNEAAILAVNEGKESIEHQDLELAFDNITLGREIQSMEQSQESRFKTAIHEAGHAAGWLFGNQHDYIIHKASIVPRSHTLGVVWATPLHEVYEMTEEQMKAKIVVLLCGGLSEQQFGFGKGTGLSNDLAKARSIAYDMVVKYGMSQELRYVSYDEVDHTLPNDIATQVHHEVKKIIDECYLAAQKLIAEHEQDIEKIANLLMQKGTVLGKDIEDLIKVQDVQVA